MFPRINRLGRYTLGPIRKYLTMQRTLRSVRSAPGSLRAHYLHSSASTPNPTHVLNKTGGNYKNLTLENLRSECRKRGLKVGGNKSHLVDRLTIDDASMPFSTGASKRPTRDIRAVAPSVPSIPPQSKKISTAIVGKTPIEVAKTETASVPRSLPIETVRAIRTTALTAAKGDDSTIEFYRMPDMGFEPVQTIAMPIQPVMPDDYSVRTIVPDDDPPFAGPEISHVSGDIVAEPIRDIVDNSSVEEANTNQYSTRQDIPARDKKVLASLLAGTLAWWGLGSLTKKESY
ncbi:hypothetical protein POJ06DRAFT_248814 [Lipomyces tetrasporus]|uniref:SAP domain-containing protein n=1 Tax=Lipomyces tetrasporus TaxID=54092 RepID=A0AAD7QV67_9ASCO|nr:uncharacterized protein POJ06DRAFT_248814 [Lipomyces tetrasporus]KAJ8102118.1 hypothetical protein POJ06DRAFT_248814 [Lipomyces tetrasporus]